MRALAAAMLAFLCALQFASILRAPPAWSPAAIGITLAAGEVLTLGQHELAAPQAERRHLQLRRDAQGDWWAANASNLPVVLQDQRIGSVSLRTGQTVQLGASRFTVIDADSASLTFEGAGHQWHYDGAVLLRDGAVQAPCPDARLPARLGTMWNRLMPPALKVARPLGFGGNLRCDNRLGLPELGPGSATLMRHNGQLLLRGDADAGPVLVDGAELASTEMRLTGVDNLTVGRTRFKLRLDGERLLLLPMRHVALLSEPSRQLPPQVAWQWQLRPLWALSFGMPAVSGLLLAFGVAAIGAIHWQHGRWPFERGARWTVRLAAAASALLAICGLVAVLMQRAGQAPGVGISVALGCAALWCCLLQPGRTSVVTGAALALLAVGMQSQLELGLGGFDSSLLRHYQKTVALLAIGLGLGCQLRLRLRDRGIPMPQNRIEWLLAAVAAAALLALLLQVLLGDETGVFDLQPVEFAKLALTALTAHCIAVGLGWQRGVPDQSGGILRWCRLAAPALLFGALLALALVQVDDYSPLILLLVWSISMGLAYALAARKVLLGVVLLLLAGTAAAAIGYLHLAGSAALDHWNFYADRFLVWLDPSHHPHTGQQLLLGARAIAEGAWWGADGRLGLASLGQAAGSVLQVPAVQDDFAPSFFLNRHGLAAALGLWLLQAVFLGALLHTAARAYGASLQARDFRHAWLGRFRCFALCGGAAFVLGHLLLSWGTNLAIFPIMGQPMSFLSAGGSHLLFFICPLLAMCAISTQSLEEKPSCPSTFNTKY